MELLMKMRHLGPRSQQGFHYVSIIYMYISKVFCHRRVWFVACAMMCFHVQTKLTNAIHASLPGTPSTCN